MGASLVAFEHTDKHQPNLLQPRFTGISTESSSDASAMTILKALSLLSNTRQAACHGTLKMIKLQVVLFYII